MRAALLPVLLGLLEIFGDIQSLDIPGLGVTVYPSCVSLWEMIGLGVFEKSNVWKQVGQGPGGSGRGRGEDSMLCFVSWERCPWERRCDEVRIKRPRSEWRSGSSTMLGRGLACLAARVEMD